METLGKSRKEDIGDWSTSPGCFERHLSRRLNNPLFPPSERVVTRQEFRDAKALERARDAAAFKKAFEIHVKEGFRLQGRGTLGYVNNYLKRTWELMERATAIDGSWHEETRVLEAAPDSCKQLLNSETVPEAAATLERVYCITRPANPQPISRAKFSRRQSHSEGHRGMVAHTTVGSLRSVPW